MKQSNQWYKNKLKQLRADRGNACEICTEALDNDEKSPNLQFAHISPTGLSGEGRGRNRRVLDIMKHPKSYLLLCRDCHIARDDLYS